MGSPFDRDSNGVDDALVYFYPLSTTPPAFNKYTRIISDLVQYGSIADALPGGAADAIALCQDAKMALESESAVIDVDITDSNNLIIVGDIHGQFTDLLHSVLSIQLNQNNHVTNDNEENARKEYKFLFLGDYVDRGPKGLETITLLLALKIEYPNHIFLIRGNHEEAQTCRMYGFFQECRFKLELGDGNGSNCGASSAWLNYNMAFCWLPLAAVVHCPSGMFFCAHGGLSPQTKSIEDLKSLQRNEYGQAVEPTPCESDARRSVTEERNIIDGLLWSDPDEEVYGCQMNFRGCGYIFGPEITKAFLDCNYRYPFPGHSDMGEMQFLVRAHQCVQKGYRWDHSGLVLTLFSAPNYCGVNNNKGAIAVLHGSQQVGKDKVSFDYIVYEAVHASLSGTCSGLNLDGQQVLSPSIIGKVPTFGVTNPNVDKYFKDKD